MRKCFRCGKAMSVAGHERLECNTMPATLYNCSECGNVDTDFDKEYKTRDWYKKEQNEKE